MLREHVTTLYTTMMDQTIRDKTILITGGTGSFGSTVVQHLVQMEPRKIIIFSRDEKKQFDMRNAYRDSRLEFRIGDVRDAACVRQVMRNVHLVFHAAALKQVPTGEFFPLELVKTNVVGSANVMQAALDARVERVVILSTDKAVYPINTMGLTKAIMEKIMIAHARDSERTPVFCGVRYGNVMYSRGSVIPLFIEQMQQGKELTVTNPDMTRFMLPLTQSVDLVLYALNHGAPGDIYVRKAPACTIATLAAALRELFHYGGAIREIGTRAGEKLHEVLVSAEELARVEDRGEYFRIMPESAALDYKKYFTEGTHALACEGGYTSGNTRRLTVQETTELLQTLPEVQQELRGAKQWSVVPIYAGHTA